MYQSVETQKHVWSNCINHYDGDQLYGYEWGDPDSPAALNKRGDELGNYQAIKDNYLLPNIAGRHVVDIGSLGGKWLPYLESASKITCVDITDAGFGYIKQKLPQLQDKLNFCLTGGDELSGIESGSADFVFSIDSLVRSETGIIQAYLHEIRRVLNGNGKACVHLPCRDQKLSWELGFTPLTVADIKDMAIRAGFPQSYKVNTDIINHGVMLLLNF